MTVDDALDAASDHLDTVIADAALTFAATLRDIGVDGVALDDACKWHGCELASSKVATLEALAAWLRALPRYDLH